MCSPIKLTRPGASARASGSAPNSALNGAAAPVSGLIVDGIDRDRAQFVGLLLGERVCGEHARAKLAAGQVFQPSRHAIRGIALRMEMRLGVFDAVRGRLMKRQDVWKGPLP